MVSPLGPVIYLRIWNVLYKHTVECASSARAFGINGNANPYLPPGLYITFLALHGIGSKLASANKTHEKKILSEQAVRMCHKRWQEYDKCVSANLFRNCNPGLDSLRTLGFKLDAVTPIWQPAYLDLGQIGPCAGLFIYVLGSVRMNWQDELTQVFQYHCYLLIKLACYFVSAIRHW